MSKSKLEKLPEVAFNSLGPGHFEDGSSQIFTRPSQTGFGRAKPKKEKDSSEFESSRVGLHLESNLAETPEPE